MTCRFLLAAICCLASGMAASPAAAQIPTEFRNLEVLPKNISRDSLVAVMRSFTFATGLRC